MRVAVTGGTGFVGSHTVKALVDRGHRVRMLVRSADRVEPALAPHGVEPSEVIVGDVTDQSAIEELVEGCEAMLHSANVYSFDRRRVAEMIDVNVQSTERALTVAMREGLDPIVHVSSYVALLPSEDPLTSDSPVGSPSPPYSKSKAAADRVARRVQAEGAPVVITYPGVVLGPGDPYLGESNRFAMNILRGKFRLANDGPLPISDIRDVAAAHAALMQPGRGPRRYVVVGHSPHFRALMTRMGDLTGRNLWSIRVPVPMAFLAGRAGDWARMGFGVDASLSYENPWLLANSAEADSTATVRDLGIDFTPLDTTLTDTVRWLHETGHINDRQAGSLGA